MKYTFAILFALVIQTPLILGQSFPLNYHLDEDEHVLKIEMINQEGLYDLNDIAVVNLDFYDSNYWNLLHDNYGTDNYILATLTYNGEIYDSVGVQFKGETSYRRPKQKGSEKFSFDIKIGEFVEDQEIDAYSTLNFNNAFEDESFMREVIYGRLAGKHIVAPRGNFVQLYLNGESWGLYANIQQVNNDLLREWFPSNDGARWRADTENSGPGGGGPQWGDGTAALNYHGEDTTIYQGYYLLKSNDLQYPWSSLVDVCRFLNADYSENYVEELSQYLDIDQTLWFLATEILFSDDDSYIYKGKNDYSLFFEEETAKMHLLEIDGNSILGNNNLNWGPFYHAADENYPLLHRLLDIPDLRQRYLAHVRTILEDSFNEDAEELIDDLKVEISDLVAADSKTSTTFNQFNSEVNNLKTFMNSRKQLFMNHHEVDVESPQISALSFASNEVEWQVPGIDDELVISCNASHSEGIETVNLFVSNGLQGDFVKYPMTKNGENYEYTLSAFQPGAYVRFYIQAIASNQAGTHAYLPAGAEHEFMIIRVSSQSGLESDVVINEFMASNSSSVQDQDGEYDDWIELYNNGSADVDLGGYYLSDKTDNLTKWPIPEGTIIEGNDYLIVWADENGSEEGLHANFKLSKSGEHIYLVNPEGEVLDEVIFGEQETDLASARVPNGTGSFIIQDATFGYNNDDVSSISAISDTKNWVIYPNPADRYLNIVNKNVGSNPVQLQISSISGTTLVNKLIDSAEVLDISGFPTGFYIVKLDGEVLKLIID